MPSDEEINNALLSIYSRLGVIEGKVNLVARAHKQSSLEDIETAVRKTPLLGQIYLLLDGSRIQTEILDRLGAFGISTSPMSVSRAVKKLETDFGLIDLVAGSARVFRKDAEAEKVFNLSANIRKWLAAEGATIPEGPQRQRQKKGE